MQIYAITSQEQIARVITEALGSDSRIGKKYLKGGIAYGGPCFPRDNKAFVALGKNLGVRTDLAEATDSINNYQTERLTKIITSIVPFKSIISIPRYHINLTLQLVKKVKD